MKDLFGAEIEPAPAQKRAAGPLGAWTEIIDGLGPFLREIWDLAPEAQTVRALQALTKARADGTMTVGQLEGLLQLQTRFDKRYGFWDLARWLQDIAFGDPARVGEVLRAPDTPAYHKK